jgi:hypothetical protein
VDDGGEHDSEYCEKSVGLLVILGNPRKGEMLKEACPGQTSDLKYVFETMAMRARV